MNPGNTPRTSLAFEQARNLFDQLAAQGTEVAYRWLRAGCECRAQLMIEKLQLWGVEPWRIWAVAVGRDLMVPAPGSPGKFIRWRNHVAPAVPVDGTPHGLVILDPSLSRSGPLALADWMAAMRVSAFEVAWAGLSQTEILNRQTTLVLQEKALDAMVFCLELNQPPIPEVGGTGFCIGPDPPEGASDYSRKMMKTFLDLQQRFAPDQP